MKKKRFLFLLAFVAIGFFSLTSMAPDPAEEEKDYSACLKKYSSKWGEKCLKCSNFTPNSYTVFYRNTCTDKLDVKCAVQESNKQWRFFLRKDVAPNDSVVVYACDGTGKSLYWAKKAGDPTTAFPTDQEIAEQYGK